MGSRLRPGHLTAVIAIAVAGWTVLGALRSPAASGLSVAAGVPMVPQRIIAASVLSTEVLLEIVPRERIAAVSIVAADPRWSLAAAATEGIPRVGQTPEDLLALRPDLVVTDPFTKRATQELLEAVGVRVVRTGDIATFDDIAENIRMLGRATGREPAADDLVDRMNQRLQKLAVNSAEVHDWRVMNLNGSLDTYGRGSLFSAAVRAAGAINEPEIHGVGAYQSLDVETVLAWRPDAFVVVGDSEATEPPAWLSSRDVLALSPAMRQSHVVQLPAALLGSTSHHAVGIAERLQRQLRSWNR